MRITEVANKYGLSVDTLRYYEKKGLFPKVTRTPGGTRDYTEDDCLWVEYIKCMRSAGVSIETLVEYVKMFLQGDDTIEARKNLLIEERRKIAERIAEQQQSLQKLDSKIARYDSLMRACENKLSR